MSKKIRLTLVRGLSSITAKHRQTVAGLGLKKRMSTSVLEDTSCIRGMIKKVEYLLKVEENAT